MTSPPHPIDLAWLQSRLAEPAPDITDPAINWPDETDLAMLGPLTDAAVLVGIVGPPHPGILLTKRTSTLRNHSGQVSFPGGRIDPEDVSPEVAALREAREEIGLDPALVTLVGRMPPYVTGTGFRIIPVVGLITEGFSLTISPEEVEEVFILPLPTLLDATAPQRHTASFNGRDRTYWAWPHDTHHIWGATAAILIQLAKALRLERGGQG